MKETSEEFLSHANSVVSNANALLNKKMVIVLIFFFLLGLLLPHDWAEFFGPVGLPISTVADLVPAIQKVSEISPISELVRGFFGLGYLLVPCLVSWYLWGDRTALPERIASMPKRMTPNPVTKILFLYLVCLPICAAIIWLLWEFPGSHRLGLTPTKGQMFLSFVLSYRICLATFGAFFIFALSALTYALVGAVLGPFILLISRSKSGENLKKIRIKFDRAERTYFALACAFAALACSEWIAPSVPSGRWGWLQSLAAQWLAPNGVLKFLLGVSVIWVVIFLVSALSNKPKSNGEFK